MNLFVKYVFSAVACLGLCCSFVGCGGSGEPSVITDDADAAEITEYDRLMSESEEEGDSDGADDE
jgi:hypothetical protein